MCSYQCTPCENSDSLRKITLINNTQYSCRFLNMVKKGLAEDTLIKLGVSSSFIVGVDFLFFIHNKEFIKAIKDDNNNNGTRGLLVD